MKPTTLLAPMLSTWAAFALAQPDSTSATAHPWQASQRTDPAQTYTFTRFTLVGLFASASSRASASSPTSPDRPALTVDCIPGTREHPKGRYLSANLLVGPKLKIVYVEPEEIRGTSYYPKIDVRYRTDDAKESRDQWSTAADQASASIPRDVTRQILHAHTLAIITVADEHGSPLTLQFNLPDASALEQACNMDDR